MACKNAPAGNSTFAAPIFTNGWELKYASSPSTVSYTHLDVYKRQGDICAITLSFFPDAWQKLTNLPPEDATSIFTTIDKIENKNLKLLFERMLELADYKIIFETLQNELIPYWNERRENNNKSLNYIKDWAAHIFAKTAVSHAGKSVRQIQRHIKNLTGKTG